MTTQKSAKKRLEVELEQLLAKQQKCCAIAGAPGHSTSAHARARWKVLELRIAELRALLGVS